MQSSYAGTNGLQFSFPEWAPRFGEDGAAGAQQPISRLADSHASQCASWLHELDDLDEDSPVPAESGQDQPTPADGLHGQVEGSGQQAEHLARQIAHRPHYSAAPQPAGKRQGVGATGWGYILELPDDVLLSIFARLPLPDRMQTMFTCSRLHDVGQHDDLWVTKDATSAQAPGSMKRPQAGPVARGKGQSPPEPAGPLTPPAALVATPTAATNPSSAAGRASGGVADTEQLAHNVGTSQFAGTGAGTVLSSSIDLGGNKRYHTSPGPGQATAHTPPGHNALLEARRGAGTVGATPPDANPGSQTTSRTQAVHNTPASGTSGSQQRQGGHHAAAPHGQHRRLHAKLVEVTEQAQQAQHCGLEAGGPGMVPPTAWLVAKGMKQAAAVGRSFFGLWQAHDQVRVALCTMWQHGQSDAAVARRLLTKLTRFNWSLTYEALHCAFIQCTDLVALQLKCLVPAGGQASSRQDCLLWSGVLEAWGRYRQWMAKAVSLCGLLAECVSAERGAEMLARGRLDSPTLFDAGKGAFRSQVVMAYGLRKPLQAALLRGGQLYDDPESVAGLICDIRKMLQELDVPDDNTQVESKHTREKLRRCFGLESSVMDLQLRGPLRVPALQ